MPTRGVSLFGYVFRRLVVAIGAAALTLAFFLVLPLMQTITKGPETDLLVQQVDSVNIPPPPPPPEEESEEEPEPEEEPPELIEEAPPLDLSQLELALNPGFGAGLLGGDFSIKLDTLGGSEQDVDALFSLADLDQKPRALYQTSPTPNAQTRKKAPGKVYVLFIVNQEGRVENPVVQSSSDEVFEQPALAAVKKWRFEPGKRKGKAVRFRMRVPITFPGQ